MISLKTIWPNTPSPYAHIEVTGLTADSRQVQQGFVFVALQGRQYDARRFMTQAIEQGAVAVLCQSDEPSTEQAGIPIINIADLS
ncbi:MAG TPA: Mur ligase domain-containing protein, partial [Agitococcus sp.]|nr:Mur ligase domain-containing protein [Agitococcus sp.]